MSVNPIQDSLDLHLVPLLQVDESVITPSSQSPERDALSTICGPQRPPFYPQIPLRNRISIGAAAENAPGPQPGPHLERCKQPYGSALAADERAELIGLQLQDIEIAQHPLVEALSRCRGSLEPPRDGVAGMARDPGGRRNAHALDAQACDLVELPSRAAKTAVCCPKDAPVPRAVQPSTCGTIVQVPHLGGLHHHYERRAA